MSPKIKAGRLPNKVMVSAKGSDVSGACPSAREQSGGRFCTRALKSLGTLSVVLLSLDRMVRAERVNLGGTDSRES